MKTAGSARRSPVPSATVGVRESRRAAPGRCHLVQGGFTLLEILLSLAIIALLASVLIGGSARLLNDRPTSADEVFWQVVQAARKAALKSGKDQRVTFKSDLDGKRFVVAEAAVADAGQKEFPVPSPGDLAVTFVVAQKGGNAMLIGGQLVETQTLTFVTFYADGTCSPFRAQFQRSGNVHIVTIDPWTCAPVLTPPDPNAPPAS